MDGRPFRMLFLLLVASLDFEFDSEDVLCGAPFLVPSVFFTANMLTSRGESTQRKISIGIHGINRLNSRPIGLLQSSSTMMWRVYDAGCVCASRRQVAQY
mmetsp:Transcript_30618/g.63887  ORF Transcript_30618/g.63887 Transcript_30618/m.63887 type:complete len:100 (+) Transcript_30618:3951-4250(+)